MAKPRESKENRRNRTWTLTCSSQGSVDEVHRCSALSALVASARGTDDIQQLGNCGNCEVPMRGGIVLRQRWVPGRHWHRESRPFPNFPLWSRQRSHGSGSSLGILRDRTKRFAENCMVSQKSKLLETCGMTKLPDVGMRIGPWHPLLVHRRSTWMWRMAWWILPHTKLCAGFLKKVCALFVSIYDKSQLIDFWSCLSSFEQKN